MFYFYLLLLASLFAGYSTTRKVDPAKARRQLNRGMAVALVFAVVFGGYALGRDLARSDNAAHDLCRP
jgi:hypothetical protein